MFLVNFFQFNKIVTEGLGPITIFNGKEFSPIYGVIKSS